MNLRGQSFKSALGDSMFREQYIGEIEPAVAVGHHEYYKDDHALINDLSDIMNAELRELSAAGCPLIQVEEPPHHGRTTRPDCTDAELEFLTEGGPPGSTRARIRPRPLLRELGQECPCSIC